MGKRIDTAEFIRRSRLVHGDKYDYSKTNYVRASDKVCITCPTHGEFWQLPFAHFYRRGGCKRCAMEALTSNKPKTLEKFIEDARAVHGDKYDYSKVDYKDCKTKVCIICPIHGEFWQTPDIHVNYSCGCQKCKIDKVSLLKRKPIERFIEEACKVHDSRYDYSMVEYKNTHEKVCIICPKHGEFWQEPNIHLDGCGCPSCANSMLEMTVEDALKENGIEYELRKYHPWLLNEETNYHLTLDFYLPRYNIAIECQGEQHFEAVGYFGGKENLEKTQKRDITKKQLCKDKGVKLIYFLDKRNNKYMKDDDIYFNDVNDIIMYVKEMETVYQ